MQLRTGFELVYRFPQPTPIILVVNIHDSRAADIVVPDQLVTEPAVPINGYRDGFGNRCNRVLAPAGRLRLTTDCVINDGGEADDRVLGAGEDSVQDLPGDLLVFLLGSRYCETDLLSDTAWQLFGGVPPGYARVQAICDYVHRHIAFDYQSARATRSAAEVFRERTGVCRDHGVGDFAAWFDVWIGGRWHTFGPNVLEGFRVWTDEVPDSTTPGAAH